MSHYRVAVFSDKPDMFDALLAPYSETDSEFFSFIPLDEDKIEWLRSFHKEHCPEMSFEEFLTSEGYINSTKDGSIGYMANPDAKWDWYTLGGGDWQFSLKRENSGEDRKNDYVYTEPDYNEDLARKEYKRIAAIAESGEDPFGTYSREDAERFIEDYPDEELYLLTRKWNYPYAFITPDGEWHAPGTVGWWAMSDDTPESLKQYIKEWIEYISSEGNPFVNFVDCHI